MENKLSLEEFLDYAKILPPHSYRMFLKTLKLAIERAKKGEKNV